ncbi:MAG: right-handed parallel beta-helix repeat-containing protein [Candidatus Kariarchaeaceae archaeon]|jgi:parallel beta-helix repeat protein
MKSKVWRLLLVIFLFSVFFHHSDLKYFNKTIPTGFFDFSNIKQSISSYNETGDIRIFNNATLASYASSGIGSKSNPYILENYNVTTNANEPLYISSTSAYAIIRNNIFDNIDGSSNYGVFLWSTNHITLQNNTIRRAETGIYSSSSNDTKLLGNKFELIDGGGAQGVINFALNQNSLIKDHTINVTGQKGIYLQYTNTTRVENNTISGVTRGIELTYSAPSYPTYGFKNVVINNTISEVTMSAIFDSGKYNTYKQNIIKDLNDIETGIELFGADYTLIENNTVIDALNAFSLSMDVNYITIAFNTVTSSSAGIYAYLSNVQHGRYYNNTFTNNSYGVSFSPSTSSMNNSFSYNILSDNFNGFSIGDNLGMNITLNSIAKSSSSGILLTSSTSGIWILNNSIMHSGSYGLTALGSSTADSRIMYNDFYNNSGTPGQVYDSSGYNIEENFYADHSNIDSNADGYADSEYNLDGGSYTDSKPLVNSNVIYTPLDVQKPVITTDNTSTTIVEYGLDGLTLSWIGTDENAESYMITKNSTNLFGSNQNWNSNKSVAISLDGLAIGFHIFTITFYDSWNNSEENTINVIVQDSTLPFLSETVNSQSVEYGVKTITWTAVDLNPGNYSYWISNLSVIDQHWDSGVQNSISIESLPLGSHELILTIKDTEGQSIYIYSTIVIQDTTLPQIITSPVSNISFLESTSSVQVSYNVTDELPDEYSVEINGTVELTASWNDSILSINLAGFGLGKGVYNFTVIFFDNSSNHVSHTIIVKVGAVIATSTTSTPETSESETTSTTTTSSSSPSTQVNTSSTKTTLPSSSITGDSPLFMLSLFLLSGMILRNRRKYD